MTPDQALEAAAVNMPDNLPPLPPVPAGFDRWIDRGTDWKAECATYACTPLDAKFAGEWVTHYDAPAHGSPTHHYLEAVREPAKDDPNNLEGNGLTREEMAASARELNRIAPTPADKFALMFGRIVHFQLGDHTQSNKTETP